MHSLSRGKNGHCRSTRLSRFVPLALLACSTTSVAQLSLPSPAFQPPPASSGAVPSNSTSLPNPQWVNLLGDLLWFYEAQRSGQLPDSNRVSWRNSSALDDVPAGGYYDAGDYLKFTYPLSFTLISICWGALNFGNGYEQSNQTAYLDSMLRWGLDWLMEAHLDDNTLIVQVGDVNIDNNYWGGDQDIPTPRPSYQINSTNPGTDAAAAASAAFSSCSMLYSKTTLLTSAVGTNISNLSTVVSPPSSIANSTYSQQLITHAQSLFSFASNTDKQLYSVSVPQSASSYGSSGYEDDLVLAGLFLSVATSGGNSTAYSNAKSLWDSNFKPRGKTSGALNWDGKSPMLPVLGAQIVSAYGSTLGVGSGDMNDWMNVAESYLDTTTSTKLTSGGLLYYTDGDSTSASLNPALNSAMLIMQYLPLATDSSKASKYASFGASQLNYALGSNPMSMPYVVGVNPNSPANPHSAMASGGTDIGNIDTSPANEMRVLYGAVVGGPDKAGKFWDIRSDYPQTEVALDYNAPLLTLAAVSLLTQSSDPFYTSLQDGAYASKRPGGQPCDYAISAGCHPGGLSKGGKIAVAVVVTVVGLVIFGGIGCLFYSRSHKTYTSGNFGQ